MALQARRFHGKPLLQPTYNFRDVPYCTRDLSGSTISIVTERQHLVDSIAELTLLCSEAARRKKPKTTDTSLATKKSSKPLSIEYIFDRIDTDDPLWGMMVRTDTPMSLKGRVSNLKSSPNWKRGMLQGFITMTTFTNWQSTFRFDSLHEMAFGQDDDELEDQMKAGMRVYDKDGTFADELELCVKGGNPHLEGIVYPRVAEVSLFGGLGCGKQLLRLLVEHLETLKATARANYDYIVLQATENSIPFYESMGFVRVGCVQGKAPSPNQYHSNPVDEYMTKKNGETPFTIAKQFGVDVWDLVFLNKPLYPELVQKSWLKMGTTIFVPRMAPPTKVSPAKGAATKWYTAEENETCRGIAKKFNLNFQEFLEANRKRYPELTGHSKLMEGTRIQISRFDIDETDTIAYSHWCFPDDTQEDNEPSYMMALKLNRRKGNDAKEKPVAASLAVPITEYSPVASGASELLTQPLAPAAAPLAPVFSKSKASMKEPVKPKRPKTAYTFFTLDLRQSMAKEFQGMSFGDINREIVARWKALSDRKKAPYQEKYEESRAEYLEKMKVYDAEMERFNRQGPQDTTKLGGEVDTSLLEKVVKLKSTDGISGASKSGYYYVLTFIADLQWVHLIPLRKVGVFGPESSEEARGRPMWMIVGEEEGKEIDTTAAVCQPVTAFAMQNSCDADDEQWDIYDNGEVPPYRPPPPDPISTSSQRATKKEDLPGAPVRPKKPPNSYAMFTSESKTTMRAELENKPMMERTKIIAERWRSMPDGEKQKYRQAHTKAYQKYKKALKRYKKELERFEEENYEDDDDYSPSTATSSKTPKAKKKAKPSKSSQKSKDVATGSQKRKRGRPRLYPLPPSANDDSSATVPGMRKRGRPSYAEVNSDVDDTPAPKRKKGRPSYTEVASDIDLTPATPKRKRGRTSTKKLSGTTLLGELRDNSQVKVTVTQGGVVVSPLRSKPFNSKKGDILLSLNNPEYIEIMWEHYNILGNDRDKEKEINACDEAFNQFKQKQRRHGGRFFKSTQKGATFQVNDITARDKILHDIQKRERTKHKWKSRDQQFVLSLVGGPTVKNVARGKNDVVLSMLNHSYQAIMWSHFQKLGKKGTGEETMAKSILVLLKKTLGKKGNFYKKEQRTADLYEVDEEEALAKIIRDLKRRNESSGKWINAKFKKTLVTSSSAASTAKSKPSLSPSPTPRRVTKERSPKPQTKPQTKPTMSPSRYPRRGVDQPEEYPPDVLDRKSAAKPQKPLAPIFLKDYSKKKKETATVASPPPPANDERRYPGRNRKTVIEVSSVVSDDAADDVEHRKKRARTQ